MSRLLNTTPGWLADGERAAERPDDGDIAARVEWLESRVGLARYVQEVAENVSDLAGRISRLEETVESLAAQMRRDAG